jgi:hypothetical protein
LKVESSPLHALAVAWKSASEIFVPSFQTAFGLRLNSTVSLPFVTVAVGSLVR